MDNNEKFKDPLVSIIIPAYNSEKTMGKCLDSLLKLDYPDYEIIIIDDGSTDSTPEILKQYPKVKTITTQNSGPSKARNTGIWEARGDFIAFTDADCIVDHNWIKELFKGFKSDRVAGVGGDQKSPEDECEFGRDVQGFMKAIGFVSDYLKTGDAPETVKHNPSCNVMYRKEVLKEAGLFDEQLWPGEDVDLDFKIRRMGYSLYYNPNAIVYHYRPKTRASFARMMKRYGWAQGYLVNKYGPFRVLHIIPIFLLGLILTLVVLSARGKILQLLGFIILVILYPPTMFYIKTKDIGKSLKYYLFFFVLMWNWNLGFLRGLLKQKRT